MTKAPRAEGDFTNLLSRFSRELDQVENVTPMIGSFSRIEPYVIEHHQPGHTFRLIIFHHESQAWYDHDGADWSLGHLYDYRWFSPGEVVFDLGCNVGVNTMWYAMEARNGHVHAFDPYPWNTLAVQYNALLNGISNVTTYTIGIADRATELEISLEDPRILHTPTSRTFSAKIERLDAFRALNPTFMKIDIEGAEFEVSQTRFQQFSNLNKMYLELHRDFMIDRRKSPETCVQNFVDQGFTAHVGHPEGPTFPDAAIPAAITSPIYLVKNRR